MLIIRKEAEHDIKDAYEWYEKQQLNLGKAFIAEIESRFELIQDSPTLFAKIFLDVRRTLSNRFPYSIYFIHNDNDIIVIGVLHQRRNPAVWQDRK